MNWFGAAVGEEETQPEATGEEAGHPLRLPRLRPRSDAELLNGVVTELLSAATAAAKTARRPSGGTKSHRMPRPWTFGLHMNEPHPVLCVVPSHIVSRHHVLRSYPPPTREMSASVRLCLLLHVAGALAFRHASSSSSLPALHVLRGGAAPSPVVTTLPR